MLIMSRGAFVAALFPAGSSEDVALSVMLSASLCAIERSRF